MDVEDGGEPGVGASVSKKVRPKNSHKIVLSCQDATLRRKERALSGLPMYYRPQRGVVIGCMLFLVGVFVQP